jgi:hypothetical protein
MRGGQRLSRRAVLRGLGAGLALPWLEAMAPGSAAAPARRPPVRLAFVYVPNGVHMPDWTPAGAGAGFRLPWILEPLAPVREEVLVLTGLAAHRADGPSGNHARAMAAYLTGRRPPDSGGEIRLGASADQLAARAVGRHTRLSSLELGCEPPTPVGRCDAPYSCAYTSNLSWRSASTPAPPDVSPRSVFDRLFGGGSAPDRGSVLDFVREDAAALRARLGGPDRRRLEEYLTAVREVEARLAAPLAGRAAGPGYPRPPERPADYREHLRLMCDLLALAFQADSTRVATLIFANEFSNRPYPFLGVPDGHHDLSHHQRRPERLAALRRINRFHVGQLAYLLGRLRAVREGEGSLLDNCLVAYGCGNSDGDRHNHDDLPVLLAGRGGGTVRPGRHVRYPGDVPLTNLWLALLDRAGAPVPALGDSTGRLPSLGG